MGNTSKAGSGDEFLLPADYGDVIDKLTEKEKPINPISYGRPFSEYATPQQIAEFLITRDKSQHVYTKDIQSGGHAVRDAMEKYLAASKYINSGSVKAALKTPLHYYFEKMSGWRERLRKFEDSKPYFDLGNYCHMCLLEPTKFKRTTVEPKYSLSTSSGVSSLINFWESKIEILGECILDGKIVDYKKGIAAAKLAVDEMNLDIHKIDGLRSYYRILKKVSGFEAVSEQHSLIIEILRKNYMRYGDGMIPELIKHSKREISMYYTDPETELKVRIRPDAIQFKENIGCNAIISVKSTSAESLNKFQYDSAKLNYELSEGMYENVASGVTGRDFNATIMIMFQTVPPYSVAVMVWDPEDIEIGKYKYKQGLDIIKQCHESNSYPGYDAHAESGNLGLISMKQPSWNSKELLPIDIDN